MNLTILTPEEEAYTGSVTSVILPGSDGMFEILKDHAAIVSSLSAGAIKISTDTGEQLNFTIQRGFVEVNDNEISLMVSGLKK